MKKAHSERMEWPRDEAAAPRGYGVAPGWGGVEPWLSLSGLMWRENLKWMEWWQREALRLFGMGLPALMPVAPSVPEQSAGERDRRRVSDAPWVPRLEAQVIPLRRNTDPPGGEARRFSMRLPLPWSDGTNVVAVETILGMGERGEGGEGGAPDRPGAGDGPANMRRG